MHANLSHHLDFYPVELLEEQIKRYESMINSFKGQFKAEPQFVTRCPGRVNIIGEHVDYMGMPVNPMAISKDVISASNVVCECSSGKEEIEIEMIIHNTQPSYESLTKNFIISTNDANFNSIGECVQISEQDNKSWHRYLLCGLKGVLTLMGTYKKLSDVIHQICQKSDCTDKEYPSKKITFKCVFDGQVPIGSGLSSSSALVCCSVYTLLRCLNLHQCYTKEQLAHHAANFERFIGMASGGMDQAASFLGSKGFALFIEFEPKLSSKLVKIPEEGTFVVSHTMVTSNKAETAPKHYNKRVYECRCGVLLILDYLNKTVTEKPQNFDFQKFLKNEKKEKIHLWYIKNTFKLSFDDLKDIVKQAIHEDVYKLEEVGQKIGLTAEMVKKTFVFDIEKVDNQNNLEIFKRLMHVITESERVEKFQQFCNAAVGPTTINILSELINQSHESCRDLFDCSCHELEQLRNIALSTKGCLAARLTGAGWGGALISFVKKEEKENFMKRVWDEYYVKLTGKYQVASQIDEDVLFSSVPSQGAITFLLE